MAVIAGPFPSSSGYAEFAGKKRDFFGRNKRSFKNPEKFRGHGNPESPRYRYVKGSLTGDTYKVAARDYKELTEYLASANSKRGTGGYNEVQGGLTEGYIVSKANRGGVGKYGDVRSAGDFIDFGFSKEQEGNLTYVECKGGHIKALTYNPKYLLLKVEFSPDNGGDVCVFFNLPANVATTLMYLGENGTMAPPDKNGRERHAVGVEFWNLVRVRGTIHDTQYQFTYEYGGPSAIGSSAGGADFSYSEQEQIAETTQERNPYRENIKRPVDTGKRGSEIVQSYDMADLGKIFDTNGEYRPWFNELVKGFTARGESWLINLAGKAASEYKKGNEGECKRALRELARSNIIMPDMEET